MQVAHNMRYDERVQHYVEGIEHPSKRGGNERAALARTNF
jgi:hypothetical protein